MLPDRPCARPRSTPVTENPGPDGHTEGERSGNIEHPVGAATHAYQGERPSERAERHDIWTILKLLEWTTAHFKTHTIDQPRCDAEILLSHALGLNRLDLYLQYDRPLEATELAVFKEYVKRRVQREPVAYIVGEKGFWTLDLEVSRDVLIPRPETELIVEAALGVIPPQGPHQSPFRVLDLGTGSGAIVLALAQERPGHRFFGVDSSYEAVRVAQRNARKHGLHTSVAFFQGNWCDALKKQKRCFDVIVSNPPYVRLNELKTLSPEIFRFEPLQALNGGPDGLDAIRVIIRQAPSFLENEGWLIMEIGHDQWAPVQQCLSISAAYEEIAVIKDHGGLDRVVTARKKAKK